MYPSNYLFYVLELSTAVSTSYRYSNRMTTPTPLHPWHTLTWKPDEFCALSSETVSHFFSLLFVDDFIDSGFTFSSMGHIRGETRRYINLCVCVFPSLLLSKDLSYCKSGFLVFPRETPRLLHISFFQHTSCWNHIQTSPHFFLSYRRAEEWVLCHVCHHPLYQQMLWLSNGLGFYHFSC